MFHRWANQVVKIEIRAASCHVSWHAYLGIRQEKIVTT